VGSLFNSVIRYSGYGLLFVGRFFMLPIYFLSGFVPRRNDVWAFGSWGGHRYADNAAAYFRYCQRRAPEVELIWISHEKQIVADLRNLGYKAHYWWSPAGIRTCLRARVHFFDCFSKDTNFWLSRGAIKVCLWSGVPLKVFERDIDNRDSRYYRLFHGSTIERWVLAMMMPWHIDRPDWLIATSAETRDITARAFNVPKARVLITGFPRNDVLLDADSRSGSQQDLPTAIRNAAETGRRIFLYLPTFRDSGRSFTRLNWEHLASLMQQLNGTFLFKYHPLDRSEISQQFQQVIEIPRDRDLYDILSTVDVLISDYSSIIFDFMLLRRPIISYTPDLEEFLSDCRSLNFHPEEISSGPLCRSYEELANRLAEEPVDIETSESIVSDRVLTRLQKHHDAGACQRVFDAIGEVLEFEPRSDQRDDDKQVPKQIRFAD